VDVHNRYHTPLTWRLARLEYLALMVILSGLALWHRDQIRWGPAIVAFVLIDAIGYAPGAVAFRRAGGGAISPVYHVLYNVAHSWLTAFAVLGLWAWAIGGLEWAMAAIPIHLAGDRGIFGNVYKPLELPFEPRPVDPLLHLDRGVAPARALQEVA
jgi:hypothetical protein